LHILISVADSDPWVRDPGWVKNQEPDPGSGYGMNNPDHISESLETFFWGLKYLNSLMPIRDGKNWDPGFGMGNTDPNPEH
jgi:hypothetical protein